jgi:outer membrane protein TolC
MSASQPGRIAAVCALLLVFASTSSAAQELTLAEALRLAERHNEIPRIAAQRVAQARAARREAYASLLPTLLFSGGYRHGTRSVVSVTESQVPGGSRDTLAATGRLDLPLLDPTAFPRIAAAAHGLRAAEHDALEVRRTLQLDVAEAFFAVLTAEQVARAAAQRVEVASIEARAAERRLEVGLVGRNDFTRAELEHEAARLQALEAENGLAQMRLGLGFLIGRELPERLHAPEGPIVMELREPALAARALQTREDLRALRARVDEADALRDEPWLGLVPRLNASGIASTSEALGLDVRSTDWTIAVTATWIAYDGGARYAQAAWRTAALRALEAELDTLGRQVHFEIRTALTDLSTASDAIDVAQARLQAAERNLYEVRARFDRGLVDALAMADASEQAYLAATELAGQRFSRRLAELDLLRATGRWPQGARDLPQDLQGRPAP